jgi:hypothetical protein
VYNDATPIQVSVTMTIKAMAAAAGFNNSSVATGVYTIQLPTAATPTFNPAPGNYPTAQTAHLADTTPGATIYYTLDGSTPTTSSAVYNDATPIQVSVTTTIKAIAAAAGFNNSAVATGLYTIQQPTAATPTFNPVPGTYTSPQTVHLADTTPGATIYYTLDGSTPTTSSAVYNDATPIQVSVTTTIKAMAAAAGFSNSAVATGTYSIGAAIPIAFVQVASAVPASGTTVSVTYAGAQSAGNTSIVAIGWSNSTASVTAVTDTKGNTYVQALAPTVQSGIQSQVIYIASNIAAATAGTNQVKVTFSASVLFPDVRILEYSGLAAVSPIEAAIGAAGSGTTSNSGSLTTVNANDLLFAANYVTSGTTAAGAGYTSRVITNPDGDIAEDRIVTTAGSYSATATMSSGSWVMQLVALKAANSLPTAATPTFNPAPGAYTTPQTVHLADTTPGATIYYTLDGSNPTTSSAVYNDASPIQVGVTTTIKAIAAAAGYNNSAVATGAYTIQQPTTATPTFNPAPGTYTTPQTVHLADATPGATIYYTVDGSNPTTSSAVYNDANPIQVSTTTTIKAMATAIGFNNSAVATGLYTIQQPAAATPTFNPAPGNYATAQTVHLADTTPNATIYYTLDGSTPTTSSAVYNDANPIQVTTSTTIKAMAAAAGFNNSAVATGQYSIGATIPIAFVQVAYAVPTSGSTVSVTYAASQLAGDTNIVAIGWSNSTATVTSVTDTKGNTYLQALPVTVQSGVQSHVIYIASNIAAAAVGANQVRVTFSESVPFPDVRILEYSGLAAVSPIDGFAGASGTGASASSGPITTSNGYDLIFAANDVSNFTVTSGNGFVSRAITIPDGNIAEDQIVTVPGTYTGTAVISSGSWVMQTIALRGAGNPPPPQDPAQVGSWGAVASWPILPIHVTLMPNGNVLAFGHDATNNTTLGTVWNPNTNTFQSTSYSGGDLFCAGHGLLPDGRVFIAGGHNMANYNGLKKGIIFDPTNLTWTAAPNMTFGRWYPTVTALPDGRQLVTSGAINCDGCNATVPEIYDPKTNTWSQLSSASLNIPIYPHMFVLPDGRVLNTGSYELPTATRALNISTQTWTTIDSTVLDAGSAVMHLPGKFLKTGTSATSDPPFVTSAKTAYLLDMTQGSPAWRAINPMAFPRAYHNMTVLPDGNVLVTGGVGTTDPDNISTSAYAAEMWSPTTEHFTTMASAATPRVYHSTAVLLPDGRVLVGGGGEYQGAQPDQLNAELYSPPYLFKGARPTVTASPSVLQYGAQFTVQTPDAANIASVALLRLGSVTHAFNENQRYIPLSFTASAGALTVQGPANSNLAPAGHYMLFIVNSTGVPSVAVIVQFLAP